MLDIAPSPTAPRFAFGPHDTLRIDGTAYRAVERTEDGWIVVRVDGTGVAAAFTHSELARRAQLGHIVHVRDGLRPEGARQRLAAPADLLSTLSPKQHKDARLREAAVLAFLDCEREGLVRRTDPSIAAALTTIQIRAGTYLKQNSPCDPCVADAGQLVIPTIRVRSLRRWVKVYEDLGLAGLVGSKGNRGNRNRRLRPEELALMYSVVDGYVDELKPSQAKIHGDVKDRFKAENLQRRAAGQPDLVAPSRETVRQAILALNPLRCALAREGAATVRNRDAPVGCGLELTRPLQRVEMDSCKIDLMSLMATAGLYGVLSDTDKAALGLDGGKARRYITVAECATTRCIVGMRLCRAPSAQATLQTIDMAVRDKGVWTDSVAALSPWHQFGTPELIVTDCGTEFMNYDVRVALRDFGIRFENAPAGAPRMRARVERLFRTVGTRLVARLTGRTFSNMLEKGDYDPKAKAALTADDLCHALIRWVVDVYHNTPHSGLSGETPARCWDRLVKTYGVTAPPDLRRRRLALGTHLGRTVQTTGITRMGRALPFRNAGDMGIAHAQQGRRDPLVPRRHRRHRGAARRDVDRGPGRVRAVQRRARADMAGGGAAVAGAIAVQRDLRRGRDLRCDPGHRRDQRGRDAADRAGGRRLVGGACGPRGRAGLHRFPDGRDPPEGAAAQPGHALRRGDCRPRIARPGCSNVVARAGGHGTGRDGPSGRHAGRGPARRRHGLGVRRHLIDPVPRTNGGRGIRFGAATTATVPAAGDRFPPTPRPLTYPVRRCSRSGRPVRGVAARRRAPDQSR